MMRLFQTPDTPWLNVSLMILRLSLFLVFFAHGSQILLGLFGGGGFNATMQGFTQGLHIPPLFAALAIFTEFFAPLALLFGLLTRLAALGLACVIAVAVATVHIANGFFMNWNGSQKGEGIEYFVFAGAIALTLIIMGAGGWSVDALIAHRMAKQQDALGAERRLRPVPQEH